MSKQSFIPGMDDGFLTRDDIKRMEEEEANAKDDTQTPDDIKRMREADADVKKADEKPADTPTPVKPEEKVTPEPVVQPKSTDSKKTQEPTMLFDERNEKMSLKRLPPDYPPKRYITR